jgi:cytochrome bd ubiquinol oxidase subunit I
MNDLLAARSQMAMSLGFHIVFAVVGIGMPLLMVLAEQRWLRTGDAIYLELARRWARGTAILFAVGAVSGTVLSFELGLLWPRFMAFAGPVIGMPFSLEGFAFFTEAIFLGVYLYGWDRVSPRAHLLSGVAVAVSGAASGVFVVIANAWMNTPAGFEMAGGRVISVSPLAALANPAAFQQTLHMLIASFVGTGFAVAGIHAFLLLRHPGNAFHRHALTLALLVGAPAAVLQPLSGDISARAVARQQPAKLAALEGLFHTTRGAPLTLGGLPDPDAGTMRMGLRIPYGLSLLAFHDPAAEVPGLDRIPRADWPPVLIVHVAFQIMVALGSYLAVLSLILGWRAWRGKDLTSSRAMLRAIAIATPLGFLAIEAGWVVTEVGRQPWIINGVLRTRDAVTPMPGIAVPFVLFTLLYVGLSAAVVWLLYRQIVRAPANDESATAGAARG